MSRYPHSPMKFFSQLYFIVFAFILSPCTSDLSADTPKDWKQTYSCSFDESDKNQWAVWGQDLEKRRLGLSATVKKLENESVLDFYTSFFGVGRIALKTKVKGPFAIEMRVRVLGVPSDLSVFMDRPGKGPGFQFGADRNRKNVLWSYGHGKNHDQAKKITLKNDYYIKRFDWHKVRLEVRNGRVFGYANGKLLGTRLLGEKYDWQKEFSPMLYFYATHVQIDSVMAEALPNNITNTTALLPEDAKPDFVAVKETAKNTIPLKNSLSNSIGMKLLQVSKGSFMMGEDVTNYDEKPVHTVSIDQSFYMSQTEITNKQYEQFDPAHKKKRGIRDLSTNDNDAVVNVNWHEAMAFCKWLSKKEGKFYRLPTEAEWEYACRAGTKTFYSMGDRIPEAYYQEPGTEKQSWNPIPVPTAVMQAPANLWGFYGMHGNVEEWCHDWYGPYAGGAQTDPLGPVDGLFKVTRGGSHNTSLRYLRSAKRMGTLPDDKHWLIGFRVVMGELPPSKPLPAVVRPAIDKTVKQSMWDWKKNAPDATKPYFEDPRNFVKIPFVSGKPAIGPIYAQHNHVPAITYCPNGDLIVIWFSCLSEAGREGSMLLGRLRAGETRWDDAIVFWDPPSRNLGGSAIWTNKKGKIYHFNGLNTRGTWANLAMTMRASEDNGKTWSKDRIIFDHGLQNQLLRGVIQTQKGSIIVLGDAGVNSYGGRYEPGTALHISNDDGKTWYNPSENISVAELRKTGRSKQGRLIYGLHGSIVELKDGSLMGFSRGSRIQNQMAKSISKDGGKTWTYSPSGLQVIGSAQRNVLIRLREGPLFYAGFANLGIPIKDNTGEELLGEGLFGALSYDEGKTWKVKKLITDGKSDHQMDGFGNTHKFTMGPNKAEPAGYLDCVQTPDGAIHLISSGLHYVFNKKWIETPW